MRRCLNCMKEYAEEYEDKCPYCGYVHGVTREADMGLMPGTILHSRYIVGTVIRVRDVDICYRGWDAIFDRQVRIQEYFPRYCASRGGNPQMTIYESRQERFQEGLQAFIHESRELIRAYREPDVITYYACFEENRTAYAITEARELQTLGDRLADGRLSESEALTLLGKAWEAVEKCHELGVSHGMLDPETFWCTGDGRLILKDFGSWRYICGEPGIVNYDNPGPETDVYGLAKLFCCLVSGREILEGDKLEQELLLSQTGLSRNMMTAMKHALSHETKSMRRFQEELNGQVSREAEESFSRNRNRRRDLRKPLGIPKGAVIAAAAIAGVLLVLMIVIGVGFLRVSLKETGETGLQKGTVRMINVVNRDADEAEEALKDLGLEMSRERMEYSDEVGENVISYQEKPVGTLLDAGTEIVVHISKGSEKGVIPRVRGLVREEGLERLAKAGFENIQMKESMDEGVYNHILEISQMEGANVALGTEIMVTVCMNEASLDGDDSQQVKAPDLIGMDRAEAGATLEKKGLKLNPVEEYSDEPEGRVLAQEPKADEIVNRDTYVTVTVSIGPEKIYMKNVLLMSLEEATEEIETLGLVVGTVTETYSDSVASGKVITQSIAQDEAALRGDSVDLTVSKGKNPAKQTSSAKKSTTTATTAAPVTTAEPETTAMSETTAEPVTTAEPEMTAMSETTTAPETTAVSETTVPPFTIEASEVTETSVAVESPESVDSPVS